MTGEEGLGKIGHFGNGPVFCVSPPTGEGKAVGGFPARTLVALFHQVAIADGVAVILGQRAIADDKQLYILEQPGTGPKAVALVAVNLVERLAEIHAPALEFDMHHRQAVHEHRHIVPVGPRPLHLILVDDLKAVVVNVPLVDQLDVLAAAVIALEHLDMVFLDACGLFHDAVVGPGDLLAEEVLPLGFRELDFIQRLQLAA